MHVSLLLNMLYGVASHSNDEQGKGHMICKRPELRSVTKYDVARRNYGLLQIMWPFLDCISAMHPIMTPTIPSLYTQLTLLLMSLQHLCFIAF
jgi:hypothetical protein